MKASHEAFIQQRVDGEPEEPPTDPLAQRISGTAQAILRAMNDFWEHELLAQVLRDELAAHTDLARDARYGVMLRRRQVDQQELVAVAGGAEQLARTGEIELAQAIVERELSTGSGCHALTVAPGSDTRSARPSQEVGRLAEHVDLGSSIGSFAGR